MDAIMLRVPSLRKRKRWPIAVNERNRDVSPTTRGAYFGAVEGIPRKSPGIAFLPVVRRKGHSPNIRRFL
jgi:hypothetical protein